jgi:DNA-directed RNA polymerase specialized sigma24 family protein
VPAADVEALSAPTPMIARSSVADAVANEDVVRRALLALTPPHYRVVLVLADMLDMSSAHIAEILEMRASQVDPILNRARKKFAALVTRELDDQIGGE